jgi:ATP-dependent RNA helicase DeaD
MESISFEAKDASQDAKGMTFADLGLDEVVLKAVEAKGFTEPTPIQVLAIPRLLNGDANVIAKARTGTGKTAAFGLPLIQELRSDNHCPRALVLVPTRELCVQVATEIDSFRTEPFPRTTTVYGGASIVDQLHKLRSGVEIVVGTPGRVIDHLERRSLDLSKIEYFILDEADEMLNMGFIEDIEAIFGRANPEARVLMFSATMPPAILSIASNFMGEYEIVEEEARPEEPVLTDQLFWIVREDDKTEALVRLIDSSPDFYGLVFCQTKADADAVAKELDERHYQAAALHGDIAQSQREKILGRFRNKKTRILVATDVAARGIDIEGLSHVVNYALPYDGPTYTHRIGRTGRAGMKGTAITFVRPEERRRLGYLRNNARGVLEEGKVPTVKEVLDVKRDRLMSATTNEVSKFFADAQVAADAAIAASIEAEAAAKAEVGDANVSADADAVVTSASGAAVQSVATVPSVADGDAVSKPAKPVKAAKTVKTKAAKLTPEFLAFAEALADGRDPKEVLAAVLALQYGDALSADHYTDIKSMRSNAEDKTHIRLYIGLGRRDGMTRRGIAQVFRDLIGVPERLVDRIEVMDAFSLATLPADAAMSALELSKTKRNVPHLHIDVKEGGGDFHAGPRPGSFRGNSGGGGGGFRGNSGGGGFRGNSGSGSGGYRGRDGSDRPDRSDRDGRSDRPGRSFSGDRPAGGDRSDRSDRPAVPFSSADRSDRFDRSARPEGARGDFPARKPTRTYSRGPKPNGGSAGVGAEGYRRKKED